MRRIFLLGIAAFLFLSAFGTAEAAVISVVPSKSSVAIGEEVTVSVLLNSTPESVNAVQATVEFPLSVFDYVKEDRSKSVFNFWVEEPTLSENMVSFTGGTPSGVSGASLQVVTLTFKAKAVGVATFSLDNAIVTANDGKGTNVLQEMVQGKVTVGLTVSSPSTAPAGATSPSQGASVVAPVVQAPIEAPKLIVRAPEKAVKKPPAPVIRIPLYPEEEHWYNAIGTMTVFWEVPQDVARVAVIVDQVPGTVPSKYESQLYDGKLLGELTEGVHYVHVRFQNASGEGVTTHRKIQIDTTSPLPFTIQSTEGAITENPSPSLSFTGNDELSGIDHYEIKIDTSDVLLSEEGTFSLPPQKPGKHVVVVTSADKAGNTAQWFYNIEILPIASPTILPFENLPYIGEGNFLVRGTSKPGNILLGVIKSFDGAVVDEENAVADDAGNWEIVFNEPLKKGSYSVDVVAQDDRGASSLVVSSDLFKIRVRPLITLGGFGVTPNIFFGIVIGVIALLVFLALFSYRLWRQQVGRRVVIAQRDVAGAFEMIAKEVDAMLATWADGKVTKSEITTLETRLRKIAAEVKRLEKYVTQNIGGISR